MTGRLGIAGHATHTKVENRVGFFFFLYKAGGLNPSLMVRAAVTISTESSSFLHIPCDTECGAGEKNEEEEPGVHPDSPTDIGVLHWFHRRVGPGEGRCGGYVAVEGAAVALLSAPE